MHANHAYNAYEMYAITPMTPIRCTLITPAYYAYEMAYGGCPSMRYIPCGTHAYKRL
jgi:hypothetical protein